VCRSRLRLARSLRSLRWQRINAERLMGQLLAFPHEIMRTAWRVSLSLGAILLVIVGAYFVVFGAVYYGTYYAEGVKGGPCLFLACPTPYTGLTVVFSGYPIWSPPSWDNVNYSATSCTLTTATYTPHNLPQSCLYPPADWSPDYGRNYQGAILLVMATIMVVVAVRSGDKPTPVSPKAT